MGKKSKRKQATNGIHESSHSPEEPPSKKTKPADWFPGKFVLLKPENAETSGSSAHESPTKSKKKNKKQNGHHMQPPPPKQMNGKAKPKAKSKQNGKSEASLLEKLYADDLSGSSEDEWEDDEDFESLSEDEEVSDEWMTDTDYSEGDSLEDEEEYSFHESDCETASEEENHRDWEVDESEDDSDYVPDVEDKYIKPGEAVLYPAKGLDLAFGNSTESQILEITDIEPAMRSNCEDDEVPDLIGSETEETTQTENSTMAETTADTSEAEEMIQELKIADDEDDRLSCNRLLECARFHNCTDAQGVVIRLMNTIHFHGILIVKALANNVQINGFELKQGETLNVTSIARADYFINLTPVANPSVQNANYSAQLQKLLPGDDIARIVESFDPKTESLVHVHQGLPDSTVAMLSAYSPHVLLPTKKMLLANSPCPTSELILSSKFFVGSENSKLSAFQVNDQWNHVEVSSESRVLVIGGKNVGKSSLCQFLINANIARFEKVLLIDLDVGQPICSPAQTVSATLLTKPIIGPGYLARASPEKSFVYGDKSIMIAPFKYLRCVRQLLEFCSANPNYKQVPWIVNTMGYQKGFGLQLVCLLTKMLQPTDVIQIQHGNKSFNYARILTEDVVNDFEFNFFDAKDVPSRVFFTTHVLDSLVNLNQSSKWISNATDKRKLAMLGQLSRLLRANQTSLNDVTPFVAPIDKIRMVVMDEEYSQHEQSLNLDLLNGNLVYLCSSAEPALSAESVLECLGVGVVRGIDKIHQKIFLLLPEASELQAKVNVLAIGNIPLPAEILLKQSFDIVGNIPHVTFFKDRNASSKKYVNKRHIKDCF